MTATWKILTSSTQLEFRKKLHATKAKKGNCSVTSAIRFRSACLRASSISSSLIESRLSLCGFLYISIYKMRVNQKDQDYLAHYMHRHLKGPVICELTQPPPQGSPRGLPPLCQTANMYCHMTNNRSVPSTAHQVSTGLNSHQISSKLGTSEENELLV